MIKAVSIIDAVVLEIKLLLSMVPTMTENTNSIVVRTVIKSY